MLSQRCQRGGQKAFAPGDLGNFAVADLFTASRDHLYPGTANSQAKMPGLLQTQAEHFTKSKYSMALCAEFLGSCLFSFTGSALLSVALANPEEPNVVMAALGNGAGIAIAGTTF